MTELIARLETLVADAIGLTLGDPAAAALDENAVMAALQAECARSQDNPADMLPVLEQLEARLDVALAHAFDDLQWTASRYRSSIIKWRPDPPAMPRAVTAFMARETVRGTRKGCIYSLAKLRYESLRRLGDGCDCAARIEASFMYDRPKA